MRVYEVCKVRCSGGHFPFGKNLRGQEERKYNNALANGISCGRLASFDAPLM
jgi:hypothetical protein